MADQRRLSHAPVHLVRRDHRGAALSAAILASLVAAASASLDGPLKPLSFLAGHCFVGPAAVRGTDQHCFEPVYGGQHLRDRHVVTVDGKPVYEGETLYSAERGRIIFTYWNSIGGLGRGTAVASTGEIRFTGSIHGTPNGAEVPFATVWRKVEGGYEVRDSEADSPSPAPRLFARAD